MEIALPSSIAAMGAIPTLEFPRRFAATGPATLMFAGGGSGGHLFPGIALAERFQQLNPLARCLFVGSDRPIEQRIMQAHGVEHQALPTCSLDVCRRRPDLFLWKNWQAVSAARKLIQRHRPQVVVGLGGFASAPVVWSAHRAGIPILLLEQNAIPGRATCWLSRFARAICTTFPESVAWLPHETPTLVCGNPVRQVIADLWHHFERADEARRRSGRPHLLVLGGSLGADGLNTAVMDLVRRQPELRDWTILHQTGPRQLESVKSTYQELNQPAEVADFFESMETIYRRADLVISRAGATTLAELACAGRPTILVPFPKAADDHQRANAESYARLGAAIVVEQSSACSQTADRLWIVLSQLMVDESRRAEMSRASREAARPDAADRILSLLTAEQPVAA